MFHSWTVWFIQSDIYRMENPWHKQTDLNEIVDHFCEPYLKFSNRSMNFSHFCQTRYTFQFIQIETHQIYKEIEWHQLCTPKLFASKSTSKLHSNHIAIAIISFDWFIRFLYGISFHWNNSIEEILMLLYSCAHDIEMHTISNSHHRN
jgi:hypothetical protein